MGFCAYCNGECDYSTNVLACAKKSAVFCRTQRDKYETERTNAILLGGIQNTSGDVRPTAAKGL